ncbi:hypothetical protein RclHR1_30200001 [Rhizophagus clarus]|uniref:Uncharacterized protein n=1 Tax=Rhizophagus clarus TaxID=94130 RepID=A0A2Z6R5Y7_9GLOM|nr:hypothetical protein RclHR1_30200001 [Rhizophagus clarus]GET04498.1 hypothetical protein GLOIN_2v1470220 [Rhizophagus clarus]
MLSIEVTLIIKEKEINEEYIRRELDAEENVIKRNFEIFDDEGMRFYEGLKKDENIIERMELIWELAQKEEEFKRRHGRNVTLCIKCMIPVNKEQEIRELQEQGKIFRNYCIEYEKEIDELDIENIGEINKTMINIEESREESDKSSVYETESEVNENENEHIEEYGSKRFWELIEDITINTENIIEDVKDKGENEEMSLLKSFKRCIKKNCEMLEYWYKFGEKYSNEVELRKDHSKREKRVKTQILDELKRDNPDITRNNIKSKVEKAERIYQIFKKIGVTSGNFIGRKIA